MDVNSVLIKFLSLKTGEGFNYLFLKIFMLIIGFSLVYIVPMIIKNRQTKAIVKMIADLTSEKEEVSAEDFLNNRNSNPGIISSYNFPGVYIIYNKTKEMYYVGKSIKVFDRVNNHLVGRGNGDVYADFKYGDEFTIKLVPLKGSGYNCLNTLETHCIISYKAKDKGYNKTY